MIEFMAYRVATKGKENVRVPKQIQEDVYARAIEIAKEIEEGTFYHK